MGCNDTEVLSTGSSLDGDSSDDEIENCRVVIDSSSADDMNGGSADTTSIEEETISTDDG